MIERILDEQNKNERIVFQRSLRQMMLEDYLVTDELKSQLDQNRYQFPTYTPEQSFPLDAGQILTRKQEEFSVKIHYIDTAVYFHKHDFIELIYVYKGRCTHYIEDIAHKIVLEENELILVNQNVVHAIGKTAKEDVILKMVLPPSFLRKDFTYFYSESPIVSDFFLTALQAKNTYYGYMVFRNKHENHVKEYMEKILVEYFEQKPFYQYVVKSQLSLMLIEWMRKDLAGEAELRPLTVGQLPVSDILSDIERHCDWISLQLLAEKYGYNESYLSRRIRQATGQSFRQLLTENRCKRAVSLLMESGLSVEDVAKQCGYDNVNNLYRLLKRQTGKSPVEIRTGERVLE